MPRLRKNGRWYTDVWLTNPVTGQRLQYRRSLGDSITSRRAAVVAERELIAKQLAEWEAEAARADATAPKRAAFSGWARHWLDNQVAVTCKPSVLRSYEMVCRVHLVPYFGDAELRQITAERIATFKAHLTSIQHPKTSKPLRAKTKNNILGCLSSMLRCAVEWRYLELNPCDKVKPFPADLVEFDFYTRDETTAWLAACKLTEPTWFPFFLAGFRTGLRLGELVALRACDLDLDRGVVHVRRSMHRGKVTTPKSNKQRSVPLAPDLVPELRKLRKGLSPQDLLFPPSSGEFLNRDKTKHAWERITTASKLRRIRQHDMRHSFASQLVMASVPLSVVQAYLGHSDIRTTQRYAHLAPDYRDEFISRLTSTTENKHKSSTTEEPL